MEKIIKEAKVSKVKMAMDLILSIISAGIAIPILIKDLRTKLTLTNKRLSGSIGLIKTQNIDSPLNKINGVEVRQNLFGKMFNYGTITVVTAATKFNLDYIENPDELKTAINNQIEQYEEDRMTRQAEKMAQAMR